MTDYNTMTAQQCADWLAKRDGWKRWNSWWRREMHEQREYEYREHHPFELTLGSASSALREPWRLDGIIVWRTSGFVSVSVYNMQTWKKCEAEGPDELTARYRAAVAARMEDER